MVLSKMFNRTLSIYRVTTTGDKTTDIPQLIGTIKGLIVPISETVKLYKAGNQGLEYDIYAQYIIDVYPSDLLQSDDGRTFGVIGVTKREDRHNGKETHLQIRAVLK